MKPNRSLAVLLVLALPSVSFAAEPPSRPVLVFYTAPVYPKLHFLAVGEGSVACELHIASDGKVGSVTCDPGADPTFRQAAEAAFLKTRFAPLPRPLSLKTTSQFLIQASDEVAAMGSLVQQQPPENLVSVEGEVLRSGLRTTLAGVDVIAEGLGTSTTTDGKGRFHLLLPPGAHQLLASRGDYRPALEAITLLADGKTHSLTFHLFRRSNSELEATVQAQKENNNAPSKSSMQHEELRNVPGANNDPVRVVEDLPGVARAPYAGGQLIVRGAQPQDTGAFFDGQKIPILYHLLNGPSVLSEEMVERIDFIPGGAGVYFGRQLAGIVDIIPRSGEVDRSHGSVAIDLNKASAFLRGPIGDSTDYAAGARISYVNPSLKLTANQFETYQVPLYWDYQARIDQKLPDQSKLTLTGFGSGDSFSQINPGRGTDQAYSDQQVHFHRYQIRWDKPLTTNLMLTVSPQLGFGSDVTATTGTGAGAFSLPSEVADQSKSIGLRSQLTYKLPDDGFIHLGIDSSYERVDYQVDEQLALTLSGVQTGTTAEEIRANGAAHFGNLGLYTDASLVFGRFRLTPGARVDIFHWTDHTYGMFDPRLWGRFQLLPNVNLFAYTGVYHQAPLATQLDANIGNPGLIPERATQYGLGANYRYASDWTVRLEGFLQRRSSLPFNGIPSLREDGTVYYPLLINSGISRSMGIELLLRRELTSQIYGWISYTLSRSQQLERPGLPWEPTDFDQPNILTVLVAYRRNNKAELSARFRYASGNPIRTVNGAVFDGSTGNYLPINTPFGTERLPAFMQLDFQVNNVWSAESFLLTMYIEFQNLLARDNVEGVAYNFRFDQMQFIAGQPLNASVGAKLSW